MWIKSFVDYLRFERNYSRRTLESYQADLEAFERFYKTLDCELSWDSIDKDVVRQWMVSMMDVGNSPSSVSRRLSSLRSFYRFLLRRKCVETDPVYGVMGPKKPKMLPVYLRETEMNKLLDETIYPEGYVGLRDYVMLLVFYSTGVRVSELVGMNVTDVDLSACQIRILGKRNKERIIPYGEELSRVFERYLKELSSFSEFNLLQRPVFLDEKTRNRITPQKVRTIVQRYLSKVTTVKKKSPHVLRHTFATSMLNCQADLQSVKELLGHNSLSTTEIYTHTTFEELKKMYNAAHPRAK